MGGRSEGSLGRIGAAALAASLLACSQQAEPAPAAQTTADLQVQEVAAARMAAPADQPSTDELWCMVGDGGWAPVFPTPERRSLAKIVVEMGTVTSPSNVYQDVFTDEPLAMAGAVAVDMLPDGSYLLWVPGTGDWSENTSLLLQLRLESERCQLLSCHLYWRADVPPIRAWSPIEEGRITIDCPKDDFGSVGISFDLRGRHDVSGAFRTALQPAAGGVPASAVAHLVAAASR